jgi:hypothetical protein
MLPILAQAVAALAVWLPTRHLQSQPEHNISLQWAAVAQVAALVAAETMAAIPHLAA